DEIAQRLAPLGAQRLRIVDPLWRIVGVENHRGDADRPGERPPADLVDAGDERTAARQKLALEREVGRAPFQSSGPLTSLARSKAATSLSSSMNASAPCSAQASPFAALAAAASPTAPDEFRSLAVQPKPIGWVARKRLNSRSIAIPALTKSRASPIPAVSG